MTIHKTAEDMRFIDGDSRVLPGFALTGVGQLPQCRLIWRAQSPDSGTSGRSKKPPLDVALICRPNDLYDTRRKESTDARFTEEVLYRVPTHDGPDTLHKARRDGMHNEA